MFYIDKCRGLNQLSLLSIAHYDIVIVTYLHSYLLIRLV